MIRRFSNKNSLLFLSSRVIWARETVVENGVVSFLFPLLSSPLLSTFILPLSSSLLLSPFLFLHSFPFFPSISLGCYKKNKKKS